MTKPRKLGQKRGWAVSAAVVLIKPMTMLVSKQDWRDGDKIPAVGGCVLVANHVSHLDPLTFARFVYDHGRIPRFLAKAALFETPVAGRILRGANQIPVYRQSSDATKAFSAAVAAVEAGEAVVVYPEGTLTRSPALWPMTGKTGAARIALASGAPVIPIAQWGANDILYPYAAKPKLFPKKTIKMMAGDPVDLDDLRGGPQTPEVLHEATERIMAAITVLLEQLRGEEAPAERFDPRKAGVRLTGNPSKPPTTSAGKHHLHGHRSHDARHDQNHDAQNHDAQTKETGR